MDFYSSILVNFLAIVCTAVVEYCIFYSVLNKFFDTKDSYDKDVFYFEFNAKND